MIKYAMSREPLPTTTPSGLDEACLVCVIVPVLNGAATLGVQLEALTRQTFDGAWEVIVADNGSCDATLAVARSFESRLPLRIIVASDTRGAAHARNAAARLTTARYLAFVDADDEVAPEWLAAIVRALDEHEVVASRFDRDRLNSPDVRAMRKLAQEEGLNQLGSGKFLPHAGGSGLAVRRSIHEALGGFDETMLQLEDTEYCWRLQLAGHPLHFEPAALVHVRFRDTLYESMRQAFGYGRFDGHLHARYREHGMPHVTIASNLWGVATRALRVVVAPAAVRPRQLRALANHVGLTVGRFEALGTKMLWLARRIATAPFSRARSRLLGVVVGVRTVEPLVALTFDDGPDPETTPLVLDILSRHGAKATFFMVGSAASRYPDLVRRVAAEGHTIGHHTLDHASLPGLSGPTRRAQLAGGSAAIGPYGARFFRPPFGHLDLASWWSARWSGHEVVAWSGHARDWLADDAAAIGERLRATIEPGAIVLLHDGAQPADAYASRPRGAMLTALDALLEESAGTFRFVTLPDLLAAGRPVRRVRWRAAPHPLETGDSSIRWSP